MVSRRADDRPRCLRPRHGGGRFILVEPPWMRLSRRLPRGASPCERARRAGRQAVTCYRTRQRRVDTAQTMPLESWQARPVRPLNTTMRLLYTDRSKYLRQSRHPLSSGAIDPEMYPLHTTASAPSMRASDVSYAHMSPSTPVNADPGNVKVVVRCRAFVPRGTPAGPNGCGPDADSRQRRRGASSA